MGLYFKFSIVLLYFPIIAIYYIFFKKVLNKKNKKFNLISLKRYFRYVKLVFSQKVILVIIISSIISNSVIIIKNNAMNKAYERQQDLTITGMIVSNKKEKQYKNIYEVKVLNCEEIKQYKNKHVYVKINKKISNELQYGYIVFIKGKLQKTSGKTNYGGFDYKNYLKTKNIYGNINVDSIKVYSKKKVNFILYYSNRIASTIEKKIDNLLAEEQASILKGILLGKTEDIEKDTYEKFRVTSIAHVLAVSGMHVAYIILGINVILTKYLGKRKTKIITIFVLINYVFVTGFSASIVRATIMGILYILSGILYRKNDIWTSISISLLVILIYNPFIIMDIGLQLSYIGTIGIIIINKTILNLIRNIKLNKSKKKYKINRKKLLKAKKIQEILGVIVSAQIVVLPIMIYHFNLFGTYFLISNLMISIIIGPIIILSFIFILISFLYLPIAKVISIILEFLINILIQISNASKLPLSKMYFPTPKVWIIILYYIFICLFILIYPIYTLKKINCTQKRFRSLIALAKYKFNLNKKKNLKIIIISTILIISIIQIFPKDLKINFVDVGQGDCTFIVTPRKKTILVDGGGSLSDDYDVGKSILLPYILDRGYNKIDYIFISHFDQDHVGGLFTVMRELKVKTVIISKQGEVSENYEEFKKIVNEKKIKVIVVKSGDEIQVEKYLKIKILWPKEEQIGENILNNNSIVAKLYYKNFSMLFTGDIEAIAEKQILEEYKGRLQVLDSTVLKVRSSWFKNIFDKRIYRRS